MNIVVTGAGNGIGYETVLQFLADPAHLVFAISRNAKNLEKLKDEALHIKAGGKLIVLANDISSEPDRKKCIEFISNNCSHIDLLINNAGKLINKPFLKFTDDDWKEIFFTNVIGLAGLTRAMIPLLEKGKLAAPESKTENNIRSHIVNISSIGGIQGSVKFEGLSAYSSSKAAVIVLTECLALELATNQIAVNCLALGSVETEMFALAFPGFTASMKVKRMANFIVNFGLFGHLNFNGKMLPVSVSTP